MQINPQSQRVYLSSDSLYWISDGDCKRCRLDEHPDCTEPRHIIVSEYWMRREILPAQKDRHRSCRPGLSSIPLIGRAFQSSQRRAFKSELLIFITPRIL